MTITEFFNKLNTGTTWSAGVAFKRAAPLPLDRYSVFASKTEAETYASENAVAYPGQILAVVEATATTVYYIDQTMALKEVGKLPSGDGKTIVIGEDGVVSLYGLDGELDEAKKYQPIYENGALTWVEVSSTTVEGLQALLEALDERVETLETDVGSIKNDYLKAADKTELKGDIATAKAEAISEAKQQILGENVNADFDTLKEVAEWIASDTTNSAQLINRVTAIENDYLKGADREALEGEIDALSAYIGDMPEGATSPTVVAYIHEVVDGLKIGDYAKANELTALAERVTKAEADIAALKEVGAEKNVVATVDQEQFAIDGDRNLTLLDIAMSKVAGLTEALAGKVDKNGTDRLLTEKEAEKLEKLVIGEDGSVSVSGTIAAGNVDGLADWISSRAGSLKGLSENNLSDTLLEKLNGIEDGAQENVLEKVKIGNEELEVTDKAVQIPVAGEKLGVFKSSTGDNKVTVAEDGTASVDKVNVNALTQTEGETLILNGGSSAN